MRRSGRRPVNTHPTQTLALRNIRNQGPSAPHSSGCQEFVTVRNTRSGCGIMIVKQPSGMLDGERTDSQAGN